MRSFKAIFIATLLSSVIATPLKERAVDSLDFPVIESREEDSVLYTRQRDCDSSERNRLDQEIRNRERMKDRLDDEIRRRQDMKNRLDEEIRQRQNGGRN